MNIRKRVFALLFLPLFSLPLFAQPSFSTNKHSSLSVNISATSGVAYLYGDVAAIKRASSTFEDLRFQHVRYMLGGGIRHKANVFFSHKIGFAYGHFVADEKEDTHLSYRGYAYDVQLYQLWWQPEFTVLRTKNSRIYLFSGIGIVHSFAEMTGEPVRPQDTFKESETAALMPVGIGYEVDLSRRFSLGTEVVCYYYFSNYIDGIATKYSKSNDVAGAILFSFSYKIYDGNGSSSRTGKGLHKSTYKCVW